MHRKKTISAVLQDHKLVGREDELNIRGTAYKGYASVKLKGPVRSCGLLCSIQEF